jgi:hypothetical protein
MGPTGNATLPVGPGCLAAPPPGRTSEVGVISDGPARKPWRFMANPIASAGIIPGAGLPSTAGRPVGAVGKRRGRDCLILYITPT